MNDYKTKYEKYKQKYIITKFWNQIYNNNFFITKHKLPSYCYGYGMLEAIRNNNIDIVKQLLLYVNEINNYMFEYCLICCLEHKNIELFKLLYQYKNKYNNKDILEKVCYKNSINNSIL